MANYNVTVKVIRGSTEDIDTAIANYINSIDDSKTIRAIAVTHYGNDRVIAVIVHDA